MSKDNTINTINIILEKWIASAKSHSVLLEQCLYGEPKWSNTHRTNVDHVDSDH